MSEIAPRKLCCHLRPDYTAELKHRLSPLLNQDRVSSAARYQWLAHASWELRLAVDEIIGVPRGCGRQNNKRDPGKLRVWNSHSGERALGSEFRRHKNHHSCSSASHPAALGSRAHSRKVKTTTVFSKDHR